MPDERPEDGGMTLREAASTLDTSEKTLRNWIKRGATEVRGRPFCWRKVPGPRGEEYRLWLDCHATPTVEAAPTTVPESSLPSPVPVDTTLSMVREIVREEQGRVESAMSQLRESQEMGLSAMADRLESVLKQAQETAERAARAEAEAERLRAELDAAKRPWRPWRRKK